VQNLQRFRDPVWQAIAACIGLIALAVSTFVAYDVYFRTVSSYGLALTQEYLYSPFGRMSKVKLVYNSRVVDPLFFYNITLSNYGKNPIRSGDFSEPLAVTVASPWEVIAVESNLTPANTPVDWTRVSTTTYKMKPLLLNGGDAVSINIILTNKSLPSDLSKTEVNERNYEMLHNSLGATWTARVANVKEIEHQIPSSVPALYRVLFGFTIRLNGPQIVLLIVLSLIAGITLTWAILRAGLSARSPRSTAIIATVSILLTIGVAEIIVDELFPVYIHNQPFVSWLIVTAYLVLWIAVIGRLLLMKVQFGQIRKEPRDEPTQ
jgi:hypothetical protein